MTDRTLDRVDRQAAGVIPLPSPRPEVIGGRADSWPVEAPPEDEGYEPTIVRGRD
ncbi:hypothetical protein [Actinokineospora inagensis]|uniref:hypothetical protein n=1 Tax=Actinokineospora inagensis TaxID=103730 RepID=UPI0003F9CD65|nr:hypothetical protein [Actinokineospora inagensis]